MVAYVYIPATETFSLILFGVTLFLRKIISPIELGIASFLVIFLCVFSTVLTQEVHIPDVSTQRIYLPCKDPLIPESWEGKVLRALDFSLYARSILVKFFGVDFESRWEKWSCLILWCRGKCLDPKLRISQSKNNRSALFAILISTFDSSYMK